MARTRRAVELAVLAERARVARQALTPVVCEALGPRERRVCRSLGEILRVAGLARIASRLYWEVVSWTKQERVLKLS